MNIIRAAGKGIVPADFVLATPVLRPGWFELVVRMRGAMIFSISLGHGVILLPDFLRLHGPALTAHARNHLMIILPAPHLDPIRVCQTIQDECVHRTHNLAFPDRLLVSLGCRPIHHVGHVADGNVVHVAGQFTQRCGQWRRRSICVVTAVAIIHHLRGAPTSAAAAAAGWT